MTRDPSNLYVLAEPGARAGFIGNWLTGNLHTAHYDVGIDLGCKFSKGHNDGEHPVHMRTADELTQFDYTIAVETDIEKLDVLLYLFLTKNMNDHVHNPNDISYDVFVELLAAAEQYLANSTLIRLLDYNNVITFSDTFNETVLIDAYQQYNNRSPLPVELAVMRETNKINDIVLDANHPCSLIKDIVQYESTLPPWSSRRYDLYANLKTLTKESLQHVLIEENYCQYT